MRGNAVRRQGCADGNRQRSAKRWLVDPLRPLVEGAGLHSEIIFTNDGSRDDTLCHLLDCSVRDRRVRVVNLKE